MDVAVVGAGPGGLYFSMLLKKRHPSWRVRVFERNPAGATYGWGVVFSDVALHFLEEADPEFYRRFTAGHERCGYFEIIHQGVRVQVHSNGFSRVARTDLLAVLQQACREAGVELHMAHEVADYDALAASADLVVAADGANSGVRAHYAEHFQPSFVERRNLFAWYGTHQLFHPVTHIFRERPEGVFITHAYQYSKRLSTFLVEVDPETHRRAGLDRVDDEASRRFCEEVFRPELGGNRLLSNRSHWFQVKVVSNQRWHHRNIVLLGDALRTVHFSLGSGTRMAMQDAIALERGLTEHGGDLPAAFRSYEDARRGATANFQTAAGKSLDWYETVGERMDLDPVSFAYRYMLRTGRLSHEELRRRDPEFIASFEALHPQGRPEPLALPA